jgi:hypothetical protein
MTQLDHLRQSLCQSHKPRAGLHSLHPTTTPSHGALPVDGAVQGCEVLTQLIQERIILKVGSGSVYSSRGLLQCCRDSNQGGSCKDTGHFICTCHANSSKTSGSQHPLGPHYGHMLRCAMRCHDTHKWAPTNNARHGVPDWKTSSRLCTTASKIARNTYACSHTSTCTHAHMHTRENAHTYTCTRENAHIHMHTRAHECVQYYMRAHEDICTHAWGIEDICTNAWGIRDMLVPCKP